MKPLIGMCLLARPNVTRKCIEALLSHTDRSKFELVITDQDAIPEVKEILHEYRKEFDAIISNEWNNGIVFSHNQMMSLRKPGQSYFKLDDDCILLNPDWLDLILKALSYADIGVALCIRPTFFIDAPGRKEFFCNDIKIEERDKDFWIETSPIYQGVVGCAIGIKSEVLDQLGYFNEDVQNDDGDFMIRVGICEFKAVYVPDAVILQPQEENKHPQKGLAKALYAKNASKAIKYNAMYLKKESLYLGSHFDPGYLTSSNDYMTGSENNWIYCQRYKNGLE